MQSEPQTTIAGVHGEATSREAPASPWRPAARAPRCNPHVPRHPAPGAGLARPRQAEGPLPLRVEVVRGRAGFAALASEWDALAGRTHAELFHRHAFLSCWLEHFAPEAPLRVLTARARDGRLVAALALREVRTRYFGVPVRELRSVCNAHSSRFDMLAEDPEGAGAAFLSHLAADPSWDVLCVTHLSEGAAGWALLEASRRAGLPAGVWHSGASPYVPLPGSLKAWEARPRSNRKTLRRKRRRLAERGEVTVQRVASAEGLDALLEEGFRVESSGWKARNGTAVLQDAGTRGFYAGLAHQAAARGELALYFLRLDGKPVAFQFGLTDGPRYLAMKPGYDESLGSLSPGQLLTESVLEDCAHRGLRELDLLGDDTPSKREWTDQVRQHGWLFVFRDSLRGRALKEAKFRVVPLARRAAHGTSQRLSRVRHAVSRLRPQRGA